MRRRLAPAAAAAALTALLLAGCSMSGSEPSTVGPGVVEPGAPVEPMPADGGEAADGTEVDAKAPESDRSVITTGWMSVTVDDPIASAEDASVIAEQAGGRIDNRSETPATDTQPASASLTMRVPADEFKGVVNELRELGSVNSVSMNASDVTQQRQDLDARIEALTASVDRLQQLLGTATSIADLIAIESELTTRQAELDSLTQQRDSIVDQVDYSTLTLDLVTEDVAPDPAPDDFWSGLVAGWSALVGFASALGVAVGVLLPWFLAGLVIAAIVVTIVVATTRRRPREADATASVAPQSRPANVPDAPLPPSSASPPEA
ncbi:MAG TPA: DUF4349 domain-containing protein [Agromyces sp.]|nr:DUF4349 domain-containing protein [Agromyces sp.]